MESPNGQAVRYLREQRKRKKRMIVFLCMAAIVVVGTVMALRMSGHAMNHTVLDCGLTGGSLHRHTEACYFTPPEEGAEKQLICGTADFVVHQHDEEACYKDGSLVCQLPEIQEHTHTEACYETQQVLACVLQPGEGGHVHSDACYGLELTCGLEEGEEHIHGDDCYSTVLVCGLNEGEGGHAHTDECYAQEQVVICGKPEIQPHTHGEECYLHTVDQLDEAQIQELARQGIDVNGIAFTENTEEQPSEENRLMAWEGMPIFKCGQLQVLEHNHDDDCYKDVGPEDELASQTEDESAGQIGQRSASYQSDRLQVTAAYEGEDFPENARICIERVDESEKIQQKQEELDAGLLEKAPELKGLFKVTVTSGGEPVDLANPLLLTAVITDEAQGEVVLAAWYDSVRESLEAQGIYTLSSEQGFELLNLTDQTEQGATAQILPGTVVGIGQKSAETGEASDDAIQKDTENQDGTRGDSLGMIRVSQDYQYEDEDYQMIFHINGVAWPKGESAQPEEAVEPEEFAEPEDEADNAEEDGEDPDSYDFAEPDSQPADSGADEGAIAADSPEDEALDSNDDNSTQEPQDTQEPLGTAEPDQNPDGAAMPAAITVSGSILPANVLDDPEHPLGLTVERYEEGSEAYEKYSDFIDTGDAQGELPGMKVMAYELYYEGVELDISQCTVKLEVTAKPELLRAAARLSGADSGDGEQETPVAIAVLTTETIQENLVEDEDRVFVAQDPSQQAVAPIADKQTQAEELISCCIDESFACNFVAAPLNMDNGSVQITMGGPEALAMDGEQSDAKAAGSDAPVMLSTDGKSEVVVITRPAEKEENPHFNVEYFAVLDRVKKSTTVGELTAIDTKGHILPKNNSTPDTIKLSIDTENKDENGSSKVATEKVLTKIYSDVKDSEFFERPTLDYFTPGSDVENGHDLKQIWVKKPGQATIIYGIEDVYVDKQEMYDKDGNKLSEMGGGTTFEPTPTKKIVAPDDKTKIDSSMVKFTNRASKADEPGCIYISEKDVITLVYEPKSDPKDYSANFYDYDISTGRVHRAKPPEDPNQYVYKTAGETFNGNNLTDAVLNWAAGLSGWDKHLYAYTKEQGINSSGNYSGSGTKLAFGNVNTGTNLGRLTWSKDGVNNELNKYNNQGYQGCTFGLATGLNTSNWTIQYDNNINAPKLFNEGDATGKTAYSDYSLKFNRSGDTYTLTAVNGTGATNLDRFKNPTNSTGMHTSIWTNNFWPMDSAPSFGTGTHDVKFGGTATFKGGVHEIRFGPITQKGTDYTFPESDDGLYHNSYFGMNFSIRFTLTGNYVGPLEYLFFGDDDMWVFLTEVEVDEYDNTIAKSTPKLVCDIGGVHSSVGEIVNLWDYINKEEKLPYEDSKVTYRLDFFYTERGASGSTCWMQFTLPSARQIDTPMTSDDYGSLKFEKVVKNKIIDGGLTEGKIDVVGSEESEEFLFHIKLTKGKKEPENGEEETEGDEEPEDEEALENSYRYEKYDSKTGKRIEFGLVDNDEDSTGETVYDGALFTLKGGQYILIPELPVGTNYTIEELGVLDGTTREFIDGQEYVKYTTKPLAEQEHEYEAYVDGELSTDKKCFGTIEKNEETENKFVVIFDNIYKSYRLPKTGGPGTLGFAGVGCAMVLAAGGLWTRKKKRKR